MKMLNEEYLRCNALPAITDTFPQFSRPIALPLDLSQRVTNVIPITPPSTPSPPKRYRLMAEENQQLWRPHALVVPSSNIFLENEQRISASYVPPALNSIIMTKTITTTDMPSGNYFDNSTYTQTTTVDYRGNLPDIKKNLVEIPEAQRSRTQVANIIYVDEDTIVLTEDEEETVVSSHEYTDDGDNEDEDILSLETHKDMRNSTEIENINIHSPSMEADDDEEYVDVLGDGDEENLISANSLLQQQNLATANDLEQSGKVLTRYKLVYDNEELHEKAVKGLDKLFEQDFNSTNKQKCATQTNNAESNQNDETKRSTAEYVQNFQLSFNSQGNNRAPHRAERKRVKLRKHQCVDEETMSPVSGTIIRKLRDDEELVVRKGDIDPAFNVVEITEEAKAILASIDNKIGDYLCQLCRTLYDDAFMLAQHRCPRIVHIEYKCSECEKIFNCPANLASHKRWHKPKADLITNQNKKRPNVEQNLDKNIPAEYSLTENATEGTYSCSQCNKIFRRFAQLKKHQVTHLVMRPLDLLKKTHSNSEPYMSTDSIHQPAYDFSTVRSTIPAPFTSQHHYPLKQYQKQLGIFPFPHFDQRRFYSLGQLYISQQLERSSAFQYVPAPHSRASGSLASGPLMAPLLSMQVK